MISPSPTVQTIIQLCLPLHLVSNNLSGHIRKIQVKQNHVARIMFYSTFYGIRTHALRLLDLLDLLTVHAANFFKFQLLIGILKPASKCF